LLLLAPLGLGSALGLLRRLRGARSLLLVLRARSSLY
jgi:hypothetical protein